DHQGAGRGADVADAAAAVARDVGEDGAADQRQGGAGAVLDAAAVVHVGGVVADGAGGDDRGPEVVEAAAGAEGDGAAGAVAGDVRVGQGQGGAGRVLDAAAGAAGGALRGGDPLHGQGAGVADAGAVAAGGHRAARDGQVGDAGDDAGGDVEDAEDAVAADRQGVLAQAGDRQRVGDGRQGGRVQADGA